MSSVSYINIPSCELVIILKKCKNLDKKTQNDYSLNRRVRYTIKHIRDILIDRQTISGLKND